MVDHSQALKLTLGLLSRANTGRWKQDVNTPTPISIPIPVHHPGSQPHLLPQPRRRQGSRQPLAMGFTLVELLIVVVIIGVLSGVAMPAFLGQQNKAKVNAANIQARGLMSYCLAHFIDHGVMPDESDTEYKRLSEDPNHNIITWNAEREDNKCKVDITEKNIKLSQPGIFSIEATGDATTIQAVPAKT